MRFRPSIYSQVQLTSYAPNGGYPGFYGGEEDDIQFQSSVDEMESEEVEEPGALTKFINWLVGRPEVQQAAKDTAGKVVTKLTSGGTPSTTTPPATTGTPLKIPSNLTASERALIDACKKEPTFKRFSCTVKAVNKINADRKAAEQKKKAESSNTLWWVLGGTVVIGGAVAAVALSKKGKRA